MFYETTTTDHAIHRVDLSGGLELAIAYNDDSYCALDFYSDSGTRVLIHDTPSGGTVFDPTDMEDEYELECEQEKNSGKFVRVECSLYVDRVPYAVIIDRSWFDENIGRMTIEEFAHDTVRRYDDWHNGSIYRIAVWDPSTSEVVAEDREVFDCDLPNYHYHGDSALVKWANENFLSDEGVTVSLPN